MQTCPESFSLFFKNIDISLVTAPICLKICMYIPENYLEGSVSQDFDKGLRFCFIVCRRCHEIKTQA